ncbi:MAG: DUF721 domain-containing protein [Polyangiaceae bacterium]
MRKRRHRPIEPLGAVLARDKTVDRTGAATAIPKDDWERAVGSRISHRTRPERIHRGVLHVVVGSSAWAQELSLLSEAILEALRPLKPELTSLRFRVGDARWVRPPEGRRVAVPPPVDLPKEVEAAVARVADEELRDTIRRAAATNLAYSKARG